MSAGCAPGCRECAGYRRFLAAAAARPEAFADLRGELSLADYVAREQVARGYLALWALRDPLVGRPPDAGFAGYAQTWRGRAWRAAGGALSAFDLRLDPPGPPVMTTAGDVLARLALTYAARVTQLGGVGD